MGGLRREGKGGKKCHPRSPFLQPGGRLFFRAKIWRRGRRRRRRRVSSLCGWGAKNWKRGEKRRGRRREFCDTFPPLSCPHRYNLEEEEGKVGVRRSLSHLEAGSSSHLSSFLSAPFSPLGLVKILFGTVAPLPPWLLRRRPLFPPRFPLGFFLPTSAFHVLL